MLIDDASIEFKDEDAPQSIKQLFVYLWDNKDVFDAFTNKFLVPYCEELMKTDPAKVD